MSSLPRYDFAALRASVAQAYAHGFPRRTPPPSDPGRFLLSGGVLTREDVDLLSEEEIKHFVWFFTDDKTLADCMSRYGNDLRFGGFPYIPRAAD